MFNQNKYVLPSYLRSYGYLRNLLSSVIHRLSSSIHIYSLFTELNALISSVTKIIPHKGFHACMLCSRYEGTKAGWSVKALKAMSTLLHINGSA